MKLEGVVTNVTAFGAFVDVGVHQDGLVHISQLAVRFVRDPAEVVKVGDKIQVRVLDVDLERKRISLSARSESPPKRAKKPEGAKPRKHRDRQQGQKTRKQAAKEPRKPKKQFTNNPFADLLRNR